MAETREKQVGSSEIISRVSKKTKITQNDTKIIFDAILTEIENSIANGEGIMLKGFGTFKLQDAAGRPARNLNTGKPIQIPPRKRLKFTPGKELEQAIGVANRK